MHPPPRLVYWEVTKRCNLACVHCRAMPQTSASPDELSFTEGMSLLGAIAEVGRPIVVLTGGEPLLRHDLFDLAVYGSQCGLPMALATNGTPVTWGLANRIVGAGFRRVSISLDGADAQTHDRFRRVPGAFDRAVDGFIRLHELGMSMQVNTTVTQHNWEQLQEIHELVRKLGADAWHLFLLVPVGCGLEIESTAQLTPHEYEEVLFWIDDVARRETMEVRATCAPHAQRVRLQRDAVGGEQAEVKVEVEGEGENRRFRQLFTQPQPQPEPASQVRRGCLAGTGICFISHDGKVFPCGYLPILAGDVRQQSFSLIWSSSPLFEDLRDPDRLLGKCGFCEYRVVCGGCRARAFGRTGRLLDEEPFCNYLPQRQDLGEKQVAGGTAWSA